MNNISVLGFNDPASSWTHLAAALAFAIAGFYLIKKGRGNHLRVIALSLYSFSLVFLFSMSGVYHLLEQSGVARAVLQRLDHAAIWVLIAGTFTPVHIILFRGHWRWLILALVWTIGILGLVLEAVFFTSFPPWLSTSLYLGLGWMGALTGYKFRKSFSDETIRLLVMGGIFYTIGALCDYFQWPNLWPSYFGGHDVFHLFVILGAVAHWRFIYYWAAHSVNNSLTIMVSVFPDGKACGQAVDDFLWVEANNLQELKTNVKTALSAKFHNSFEPKVVLRIINEEHI